MQLSVSKEHNTANLRDISELLVDLEHFIFFGTLLGFERERGIIEGDDDIDIYVNRTERAKLIKILESSVFHLNHNIRRNQTPYFLQATRRREGVKTFVDFYFYDDADERPYIVERWNFYAKWRQPETFIHIPKEIIFPVQTCDFEDFQTMVPADPAACCDFLYGPTWKSPLKKGAQYKIVIEDNKPKLIIQTPD